MINILRFFFYSFTFKGAFMDGMIHRTSKAGSNSGGTRDFKNYKNKNEKLMHRDEIDWYCKGAKEEEEKMHECLAWFAASTVIEILSTFNFWFEYNFDNDLVYMRHVICAKRLRFVMRWVCVCVFVCLVYGWAQQKIVNSARVHRVHRWLLIVYARGFIQCHWTAAAELR